VAGILAVWISTTIVSGMAIVAGLMVARDLARERQTQLDQEGTSTEKKSSHGS
jgi:hypothetical protein